MKLFMTNQKKFISTFASAFVAVGLLSGFHHECPEDRMDKAVEKIAKKLDLNETQRTKLEDVKKAVKEAKERNRTERDSIATEVKSVLMAEKLDKAKVRDLVMRKQELVRKELDPILDKVAAFHDALTPEQKAKIVEHIEKRHADKDATDRNQHEDDDDDDNDDD